MLPISKPVQHLFPPRMRMYLSKHLHSCLILNRLSSSCRATQTDIPTTPTLVPICVPAFMPMPMQMYNAPYPVPIPVPVPVPVPVFVPTSRNSYRDDIDIVFTFVTDIK